MAQTEKGKGGKERRGEKERGREGESAAGGVRPVSWVELKISSVTHTDAGAGNSGNAASRCGAPRRFDARRGEAPGNRTWTPSKREAPPIKISPRESAGIFNR